MTMSNDFLGMSDDGTYDDSDFSGVGTYSGGTTPVTYSGGSTVGTAPAGFGVGAGGPQQDTVLGQGVSLVQQTAPVWSSLIPNSGLTGAIGNLAASTFQGASPIAGLTSGTGPLPPATSAADLSSLSTTASSGSNTVLIVVAVVVLLLIVMKK
jgi:hypothetical protein